MEKEKGFTHFDEHGKAVMVDVTEKSETARTATAAGKIIPMCHILPITNCRIRFEMNLEKREG